MAEQEKNIPIKEMDDGSVKASMGESNDPFEGDEKEEVEVEVDEHSEGGEVEASDNEDGNDDETEEDRERIREARREERKLKKELQKQREVSSKHKISALERRNEDLARRLAAVENTAASYQFAQVDKAIEDEATRVLSLIHI
jgi:hypothetical protein